MWGLLRIVLLIANILAEVAMHLIIVLILFVALAAIIIWVADWTSGPRSS
jgi:hypothetical protein